MGRPQLNEEVEDTAHRVTWPTGTPTRCRSCPPDGAYTKVTASAPLGLCHCAGAVKEYGPERLPQGKLLAEAARSPMRRRCASTAAAWRIYVSEVSQVPLCQVRRGLYHIAGGEVAAERGRP